MLCKKTWPLNLSNKIQMVKLIPGILIENDMRCNGGQTFLSHRQLYQTVKLSRCRMYLKFCCREYDSIMELYDRSISLV